jgi:uncharacterized ferredoxin-like protein
MFDRNVETFLQKFSSRYRRTGCGQPYRKFVPEIPVILTLPSAIPDYLPVTRWFFIPRPVLPCMSAETEAVKTVAGLMALAARTAPKAVGLDSIAIEVITGKDQEKIAAKMIEIAKETGMDFFRTNGEQVRASEALVLIGVAGQKALGLNCGGCGHATCAEMTKAVAAAKGHKTDYAGPNCVIKVTDLGIAVGSAAKTASIHNADNRIMYSAGVAAMKLGIIKGCSIVYGIPLKASGQNIFFAAPMEH